MTQQYLAGELSVLLGRLQAFATNPAVMRDVTRLRREAEIGPLQRLGSVLVHALKLTDSLCWESLGQGETSAFSSQAALCAELREFGLCASLLEEGWLL